MHWAFTTDFFRGQNNILVNFVMSWMVLSPWSLLPVPCSDVVVVTSMPVCLFLFAYVTRCSQDSGTDLASIWHRGFLLPVHCFIRNFGYLQNNGTSSGSLSKTLICPSLLLPLYSFSFSLSPLSALFPSPFLPFSFLPFLYLSFPHSCSFSSFFLLPLPPLPCFHRPPPFHFIYLTLPSFLHPSCYIPSFPPPLVLPSFYNSVYFLPFPLFLLLFLVFSSLSILPILFFLPPLSYSSFSLPAPVHPYKVWG